MTMNLDKLKFWKKKDAFADLDKELGTLDTGPKDDLGLPKQHDPLAGSDTGMDFGKEETDMSFGMNPPSQNDPFSRPLQSQQQQSQRQPIAAQPMQYPQTNTQLDLIAAKLETIKVSMESMNHRMVALERALHVKDYQETSQPRRRRGVW
jgi:hypothetical protein